MDLVFWVVLSTVVSVVVILAVGLLSVPRGHGLGLRTWIAIRNWGGGMVMALLFALIPMSMALANIGYFATSFDGRVTGLRELPPGEEPSDDQYVLGFETKGEQHEIHLHPGHAAEAEKACVREAVIHKSAWSWTYRCGETTFERGDWRGGLVWGAFLLFGVIVLSITTWGYAVAIRRDVEPPSRLKST